MKLFSILSWSYLDCIWWSLLVRFWSSSRERIWLSFFRILFRWVEGFSILVEDFFLGIIFLKFWRNFVPIVIIKKLLSRIKIFLLRWFLIIFKKWIYYGFEWMVLSEWKKKEFSIELISEWLWLRICLYCLSFLMSIKSISKSTFILRS